MNVGDKELLLLNILTSALCQFEVCAKICASLEFKAFVLAKIFSSFSQKVLGYSICSYCYKDWYSVFINIISVSGHLDTSAESKRITAPFQHHG